MFRRRTNFKSPNTLVLPRKRSKIVLTENIYKHPKYKRWRKKVFKRDDYTCVLCGDKGELEAHHLKRKSLYPELIFDINNGVTCCVSCHHKITGFEEKWVGILEEKIKLIQEKNRSKK